MCYLGRGGTSLPSLCVRCARLNCRAICKSVRRLLWTLGHGGLRFVFHGRTSPEDWLDPVTSRARQREQAEALVRGHGVIVTELFDVGESRTVAWGRRPRAAALVAALADPGRGWDAVVIGEYELAFYGSQYAAMAPLFEHYGVQLWMPGAGGLVDYASEHRRSPSRPPRPVPAANP